MMEEAQFLLHIRDVSYCVILKVFDPECSVGCQNLGKNIREEYYYCDFFIFVFNYKNRKRC
ncbi:hypothetical protein HMPREF9449_00731 [Odoribacter laneus YIT 12061]|mgnify:FL=1|uniref:Uncharacterized protein n=1 Tax=Odoribacter laneus YIT 12061 TaxID=742817 RepID=H1DEP5_9BACT|nr:hypothetical protein HMPREF9449_00731 [Odoribacter laneus YIT 12061]